MELAESLLPLFDRSLTPGLEGLGSTSNSVVKILLVSNWNIPELLARRRVDSIVMLLRAAGLSVDNVGETVPRDGGDFRGRHDETKNRIRGILKWRAEKRSCEGNSESARLSSLSWVGLSSESGISPPRDARGITPPPHRSKRRGLER